jgi:WD40 repeat protein
MFAAFSPDSTRLTTLAGRPKSTKVTLWDTATGEPVVAPLDHKHALFVTCAGVSPDNRFVVTAFMRDDQHYVLQIWDAASGSPLPVPAMIQKGYPGAAGFSQDGAVVLSWSHTRDASVWDAATGAPLATGLPCASWALGLRERSGAVDMSGDPRAPDVRRFLAAAVRDDQGIGNGDGGFNPDCTLIVGPGKDCRAYMWDVGSGKKIATDFRHDGDVRTAYFSPSGRRVVTASEDGTARIWDRVSGECLVPPLGHQSDVLSASFSPDETRVVTACEDGFARIWSVETGARSGPAFRHASVRDALFSPDGKRVVTTGWAWGEPNTAQLWDAVTGAAIGALQIHAQ